MYTKTRLYTALVLSILVLAFNMLAVVEGFYELPENNVVDIAWQGDCHGAQNHTFAVIIGSDMQAMNLPDSRSGNRVIPGMAEYSC